MGRLLRSDRAQDFLVLCLGFAGLFLISMAVFQKQRLHSINKDVSGESKVVFHDGAENIQALSLESVSETPSDLNPDVQAADEINDFQNESMDTQFSFVENDPMSEIDFSLIVSDIEQSSDPRQSATNVLDSMKDGSLAYRLKVLQILKENEVVSSADLAFLAEQELYKIQQFDLNQAHGLLDAEDLSSVFSIYAEAKERSSVGLEKSKVDELQSEIYSDLVSFLNSQPDVELRDSFFERVNQNFPRIN